MKIGDMSELDASQLERNQVCHPRGRQTAEGPGLYICLPPLTAERLTGDLASERSEVSGCKSGGPRRGNHIRISPPKVHKHVLIVGYVGGSPNPWDPEKQYRQKHGVERGP